MSYETDQLKLELQGVNKNLETIQDILEDMLTVQQGGQLEDVDSDDDSVEGTETEETEKSRVTRK